MWAPPAAKCTTIVAHLPQAPSVAFISDITLLPFLGVLSMGVWLAYRLYLDGVGELCLDNAQISIYYSVWIR